METALMCRAIVGCFAVTAFVFSNQVDKWLATQWATLCQNRMFQHDSFEPLLVTACVMLFSLFFRLLDSIPELTHRWRLQESRDTSHWKLEGNRFRTELLWYWLVLGTYDWLNPRRKLPVAPPTLLQLVVEVLMSLFVYDNFFCVAHLMLHKVPFLYKHVHAKHHTKKVMRACEAWRLTLWEEAADVGCSIAALNLMRCHPASRAIYNVIIIYLLAELHSGFAMPWMLQDLVPCGIWAGSRRHDLHHKYGNIYYQKFFTNMDCVTVLVGDLVALYHSPDMDSKDPK